MLGRVGVGLVQTTDPAAVRTLIGSLSPVATDRSLIRIGPEGDGGYLVPNDLESISACFSPGVSLVSGFERQCADAGMAVFLADASVDAPAESHPRFVFSKKFVGVTTDARFMTMDDWVLQALPESTSDLLLQIDIEGFEYEVFLSMSDSLLRRFRVIVAEFHELEQLWNRPWFSIGSRAFEKILQTHACVHIHPNNCCGSFTMGGIDIPRVMEFTFLRRDRILSSTPAMDFPHPLDRDNTGNPPLPLPPCWVGGRARG